MWISVEKLQLLKDLRSVCHSNTEGFRAFKRDVVSVALKSLMTRSNSAIVSDLPCSGSNVLSSILKLTVLNFDGLPAVLSFFLSKRQENALN